MIEPWPIEARFWKYVDKTDSCWNWTGGLRNGYGAFEIRKSKGIYKGNYAHRVSYEMFKGEIPDGLELDHLCRNRKCVNPDHLEIVSTRENLLRGTGVSAINAKKTHCPKGHLLSDGNLLSAALKRGQRDCRICHNMRRRIGFCTQKEKTVEHVAVN